MKPFIVCVLTACLAFLFAGTAEAKKKSRANLYKSTRQHDGSSKQYPNATERQRANSIAFDNGDYYESDYTAHAFGSRSWWILQQGSGAARR